MESNGSKKDLDIQPHAFDLRGLMFGVQTKSHILWEGKLSSLVRGYLDGSKSKVTKVFMSGANNIIPF